MDENQALDFFNRLTNGTEQYKTVTLEHKSGAVLENARIYAINKQQLASVIERLPDAMFDAVEGAEDADEAEEEYEEQGGNLAAVTEDTVNAFEDLVYQSIAHPELTNPQLKKVAQELDFEVLFRLGTEIINMSVENTGSIRDFHVQE